MAATARLLRLSFMLIQLAGEALIFVVFQRPPSTPPIQTVLREGSVESTITALILPEAMPLLARVLPFDGPGTSLLGPLSTQFNKPAKEVNWLLASMVSSRATKYFSRGTLPVAGSFVRSNSYSARLSGPSYMSCSSLLLAEFICTQPPKKMRREKQSKENKRSGRKVEILKIKSFGLKNIN